MLTKTLVVSNHANHDLEWLKMTYDYGFSPSNTVIYDRTPDDFEGKSKEIYYKRNTLQKKGLYTHFNPIGLFQLMEELYANLILPIWSTTIGLLSPWNGRIGLREKR